MKKTYIILILLIFAGVYGIYSGVKTISAQNTYRLTWEPVPGAVFYTVYLKKPQGGGFTLIPVYDNNGKPRQLCWDVNPKEGDCFLIEAVGKKKVQTYCFINGKFVRQ